MYSAVGYLEGTGNHLLEVYDPSQPGSYEWHEYDEYQSQGFFGDVGRAFFQVHRADDSLCAVSRGQDACDTGSLQAPARVPYDPSLGRKSSMAEAASVVGMDVVHNVGYADPASLGFSSPQEAAGAQLVSTTPNPIMVAIPGSTNLQAIDGGEFDYRDDVPGSPSLGGFFVLATNTTPKAYWPVFYMRSTTQSDAARNAVSLHGKKPTKIIYDQVTHTYFWASGRNISPTTPVDGLKPGSPYPIQDIMKSRPPFSLPRRIH